MMESSARALDRLPSTMMTTSGARGNKGNIGQLGGMRGLMADPTGRIIDVPGAEQLPRGHDRPRVLHLHPRRAQGSGRHRPAHRRLGLPDPSPGRRGAGRHHARGRLRHRRGHVDHPGRDRGVRAPRPDAFQRRIVGRYAAGPVNDPGASEEEGRRAHRRAQPGDHRGHRPARSPRPASTRSSSARR